MTESERFDIAVVGGGLVGLASAMALACPPPWGRATGKTSVVVLEGENRLAAHQSGHNSGVIHSGLYYPPGSLKAATCTEGRDLLYRFCEEEEIACERCGKLVVATRPEELPRLDELERRGRANGLSGIERLEGGQLAEHEPHAVGIAGLWVPETGIVDFPGVATAFARKLREAGATVRLGARVVGVARSRSETVLETAAGAVRAGLLINCAGLWSDRLARLAGVDPQVAIVPFRGEYHELVPERRHLVKGLLYPVPDPRFPFLDVHFTRGIGGEVEVGPNAVPAFARAGYSWGQISLRDAFETLTYPGFLRVALRYWKTGLGEIHRSFSRHALVRALRRLVPEVGPKDLVRAGAGVRAQAVDRQGNLLDDFHVVRAPGMVHVLNAPSPAATASIAIGRRIAEMAAEGAL